MSADHLLHVAPENGWPGLSLSCLPTGEHYCLTERDCTCECEACTGDEDHDPDHWGCDRQEHDYSFDGAPPCETEFDPTTCWTRYIDTPLEECLVGEFPKDGAPWPVAVDWLGDGEVEIRYAPAAEADGLVAAVAAYAGVSPDLVQVIPNREGTPSDQTGGAS